MRHHHGPPPTFTATDGAGTGRGRDEIHSFVLRVHLHARAGGGCGRMRFHLEDVVAGESWRLTEFDSVVDRLRERVSTIEATALG